MILSDKDIRFAQEKYDLITPFTDSNVGPCSVDLTLGPEERWIDIIRNGETWSTDDWDLLPGDFVLGTTLEAVNLPSNIVAQVRGKSSWMRKGLQVCNDAGYCDAGFKGQITLEFKNLGTEVIKLVPGMKICQVVFQLMSSHAEFPYGHEKLDSHYQNQQGVQGSKL